MYTYICIHIHLSLYLSLSIYIYIHIYVYIYIYVLIFECPPRKIVSCEYVAGTTVFLLLSILTWLHNLFLLHGFTLSLCRFSF